MSTRNDKKLSRVGKNAKFSDQLLQIEKMGIFGGINFRDSGLLSSFVNYSSTFE